MIPLHYFKKAFCFCLLIVSFFVEQTASASDNNEPLRIKAAVLKHFPPQYSLSNKGTPQGFAIEIIEEIARIADFKIEYIIKDSWEEVFEAVKSGQADLIPNQGITERRGRYFDFSKSIETFPVSIFTREDGPTFSDLSSLSGKKVAVVNLNIGEVLIKKQPNAIVKKVDHIQHALFELLSGNADALIFPEPVLWKLARDAGVDEKIKTAGAPLAEIRRAVSVAKGNTVLLNKINSAIDQFIGSDRYREIYTHWYGRPTPFWTVKKISGAMTALLVAVILLMGFWRYRSTMRLNRELKEQIKMRTAAESGLKDAYDTLEEKVAERTRNLQKALKEVRSLSGLLPICSHCKKIRDDQGYWNQIEAYIQKHSEAEFSHSICRECAKKYYPDMILYEEDDVQP